MRALLYRIPSCLYRTPSRKAARKAIRGVRGTVSKLRRIDSEGFEKEVEDESEEEEGDGHGALDSKYSSGRRRIVRNRAGARKGKQTRQVAHSVDSDSGESFELGTEGDEDDDEDEEDESDWELGLSLKEELWNLGEDGYGGDESLASSGTEAAGRRRSSSRRGRVAARGRGLAKRNPHREKASRAEDSYAASRPYSPAVYKRARRQKFLSQGSSEDTPAWYPQCCPVWALRLESIVQGGSLLGLQRLAERLSHRDMRSRRVRYTPRRGQTEEVGR